MSSTVAPLTNVGFLEPDSALYEDIFSDDAASIPRGGGFEDIKFFVPDRRRRAGGFFSYFTKTLIPWIKPIAFKLISNVMGDLAENKDVKLREVVKKRGLESIGDVVQKATRGGRGKRKRKIISPRKRVTKRKKRSKEDIFTSIR